MELILLAFMLFFSPGSTPDALRPYAELIVSASDDPDVLAELFVHGRYEGRWGQVGVPMGVTAWRSAHGGRTPSPHEAVCASFEAYRNAARDCGEGPRNRVNRVSYYITGNCTPLPRAAGRVRAAVAMRRVFHLIIQQGGLGPREPLTCPAGE